MKLTSIYYLHEIGGKKNQEDYIWPVPGTAMPESNIFIICDGVGGADHGEVASRMVAEYVAGMLSQTPAEKISIDYINDLLANAKQNLVQYAASKGLNKDMATTFTLLALFKAKAFIAWCGDSRVFHIRDGNILYETSDHSLVNSLVKKGEITQREALVHPQKHIILKAITGDDSTAEAEGHWVNDIEEGDYFMLCTDGLLENITGNDLKDLLENNAPPKDIAGVMQEKCLGKTRDNYSMYLLRVSPQEEMVPQKKPKRKGLVWLVVILLALAAGGLFFFNKKNTPAVIQPEQTVLPDTAAASMPTPETSRDTILEPGKSAVADSEILYKEVPGEQKIAPAPLPGTETKNSADTVTGNKLKPLKVKDTTAIHTKKRDKQGHAVQSKDSLIKTARSIN